MITGLRSIHWPIPAILLFVTVLCGCPGGGDTLKGLTPAEAGSGPMIVFDPTVKPVPELPFPNDLATVPDRTSPTGRRVNITLNAPTSMESDLRDHVNRLDGFGTFSPISLSFDEQIDLDALAERHLDNADPLDDAVYVIYMGPDPELVGTLVPLDMGRGNYPINLQLTDNYFRNDYRWMANNIIFESVEEDANCNGVLDEGEDTDFDGVLDHPNVADPASMNPACGGRETFVADDDLVTHYDFSTNTLLMRPVVPMRELSEYAVVVTKRLVGLDGGPVRSPFPYINHVSQTERLEPLEGVLQSSLGIGLDEVAFTWIFTTQSVTGGLDAIRRGLDGEGAFAYLQDDYPPDMSYLLDHGAPRIGLNEGEVVNTHVIKASQLWDVLSIVSIALVGNLVGDDDLFGIIGGFLGSYLDNVDYIILGKFVTPYFIDNDEGVFHLDYRTGEAEIGQEEVPFWLVVPKTKPEYGFEPPFPVIVYHHGYSGSKYEALGFAGRFARLGFATVGMEAAGHGPQSELADLENGLKALARDPWHPDWTFDDMIRGMFKEMICGDVDCDPGPLGNILVNTLYKIVHNLFDFMINKYSPDGTEPPDTTGLGLDEMALIFSETPFFSEGFTTGRAKDLTGDGIPDSGADYWTGDTPHTRDMVRQSVIDSIQLIRVLRGFDGTRRMAFDVDDDGSNELAGDFNADGVIEAGGPDAEYSMMGQSMGGLHTSIVAALDPFVTAAAPVSGGGGLLDIGVRTTQEGAVQAIFFEMFGPLIVGGYGRDLYLAKNVRFERYPLEEQLPFPVDRDAFYVAYDRLDGNLEFIEPIEEIPPPEVGDIVTVENLANGRSGRGGVLEFEFTYIDIYAEPPDEKTRPGVGFNVAIPADFGDMLTITIKDGETGEVKWTKTVPSKGQGYGYRRNTADMRRLLGLAQMILEPADPINYARNYFLEPFAGNPKKNIEIVHTLGDMKVPFYTGISLGRAAGLVDYTTPVLEYGGRTVNQLLIDHYVLEGLQRTDRFGDQDWACRHEYALCDVDDLAQGRDDCLDFGSEEPCGLDAAHLLETPPCMIPSFPGFYKRLRITLETATGVSALRFPNVSIYDKWADQEDRHGFFLSTPGKRFDVDLFMTNQIGEYFKTGGTCLVDDPCLADDSCDWQPHHNPCEVLGQ
ncbi:alpha/beta hydrolase family protein [Thermodesulfobacteriota bacterium]